MIGLALTMVERGEGIEAAGVLSISSFPFRLGSAPSLWLFA